MLVLFRVLSLGLPYVAPDIILLHMNMNISIFRCFISLIKTVLEQPGNVFHLLGHRLSAYISILKMLF